MQANEAIVLKWLGLSEGGYVNHPKDPGGATDRGVTQRTYDAWNRRHGRKLRSVRGISKDEANTIFVSQYFRPVNFDSLPSGLDYAMADYSVNSGPSQANKDLQRVLGFKGSAVDGISGAQTMAAVLAQSKTQAGVAKLVKDLCNRRMAFLRGLKNWPSFKNGWTTRVMGDRDGYQEGDRGVIDRGVDMALGLINPGAIVKPVGNTKAPPDAAPEAMTEDPASLGTFASGAGVLTALGAILGPLGQLHPVAQAVAVVGLLVALGGAAYVLRKRIATMARGAG